MAMIYLAARYSRRDEMKRCRDELVANGHYVTSRWIDLADTPGWMSFEDVVPEDLWYDPAKHGPDDSGHAAPRYRADIAKADAEDVMRADVTILFTPAGTRGGCHVEFGIQMARMVATQGMPDRLGDRYRLIVCGPRQNIFHNHSQVEVFGTWPETLKALSGEGPVTNSDGAPSESDV